MSELKRIVRDELEAIIKKGIDNQMQRASAILKCGNGRSQRAYAGMTYKCSRLEHAQCNGVKKRGHGIATRCTCECHKSLELGPIRDGDNTSPLNGEQPSSNSELPL